VARPSLAILTLLLCLCACGERRPPAPPTPPAPAGTPRYVVLSPALAVILRDLGVADRAVGRSGYDLALPRDLPVCGDQSAIDYEKLAGAHPTDIFLQWGARALPGRLTTLAQDRAWTLHNFEMLTLDDIPRVTHDLERITGASRPELFEQMNKAWQRRPGLERAGRVLLLESLNPPAALGPGSWHHQLLERIGGTPAMSEGGPYVVMDAESVLRLAPDAILIFSPRPPGAPATAPPDAGALKKSLGALARLDIPAMRHSRVAVIDDPLALTPSTAMIGLADTMADILSAWARTAEPGGPEMPP
jgi:ABC-type Fe3+-hydroxamate transport system substrate-binding protein